MSDDDKLKKLDEEKEALCAEFRRRLLRIINQERKILGLIPESDHEIDIYY